MRHNSYKYDPVSPMRSNSLFKWFFGVFGSLWVVFAVVGAIFSFASGGLVLYILYRIATHPW